MVIRPTPLPPLQVSPKPAPADGKDYRLRPLKRRDRENVFKLLAADGWPVDTRDQELCISWVVQHPETETMVAHDFASYDRLYGVISMSHRPQLKLGGRVACIDLFAVADEHRQKPVGTDLLAQAQRRAEALGCKRMELYLPAAREYRHDFFEQHGFSQGSGGLFVRTARSLP
jgi:GNAT superfamily N-acetyltransferase